MPEQEAEPEAPPSEEPGPSRAASGARAAEQEPERADRERGGPQRRVRPDQQEDVLADTPEFLRDAPEDDELWFEQGKPKDFDF